MQWGLEILIQVVVTMDYSQQNKDALIKYETLVQQNYTKPVDGRFEDVTEVILKDLESDEDDEETDENLEQLFNDAETSSTS